MPMNLGQRLSDEQLQRIEKLLGPHNFQIIVQQPTWNGIPLLNPAQFPLANNRPSAAPGQIMNPPLAQPAPEKHYVQTRQPGAGAAAAAPGKALAPFEQIQKAAIDNMKQVAEAQVRLAASGIVSIDTLDQQSKALAFLTGQQKLSEEQTKRLSKDTQVVRDAFMGIQKSMVITSATLAGTFAELKHMAGAAQPGLWKALDGSMQLVTAQLGSALVPEMMSVADSIMDVADWLGNMDEGARRLVAAGVIAIPATVGLGYAMRALAPAAHLAKIGVQGLIAALGPIGGTLAAIGIMAGGVAGSVAAANYFFSQGKSTPEHAGRAGQAVTESELHETLSQMTIGNRRSLYGGFMPSAEDAAKKAAAMTPEQHQAKAAQARGLAVELRGFNMNEQAASFERLADVLERAASQGVKPIDEERSEAKQNALTRQARHYNTMITEAQKTQKPHYSGLTDVRKQIQLSILDKSPIEMQLLKIQRDNIPVMVNRLNGIMRQLEDMNRRGRNQPG